MKFRAHDTFFIRKGWLSKGILRAIGLIAEQVAASNIRLLQEFDGVSRIIVIARREQKSNRIPQPIHNGMDFRIQ